jgi:type IX secretion system PorP/SprF family membrane protein
MMKLGFLGTFFLSIFFSNAQDIHWSQFANNDVFLNPANSGKHNGTYRFIVAYKDQWRSVTKPFQTFSASFDSKLKNPDFGLGISFLNDKVGDGKFKTFELNISPSYFIPIDKLKIHSFYTSIQIGLNHRQFDFNQFYFDEQYNGVAYDQNLPITEDLNSDKKTNLNIGAGVIYSLNQKDGSNLNMGFSTFNINQPNQGFYGTKVKRDPRISLFATYDWFLGEKFTALPSFIFQKQGSFKETVFGGSLKYALNPSKISYKAFQAGIFYRMKDALIVKIGLDYKSWFAGVSYDVNVSSLIPASSKRGGLEINLKYIIYKFKPKNVQYRICPDFI